MKFCDLKKGDKFIAQPTGEDIINYYPFYLFIKTDDNKAIKSFTGTERRMPACMDVIKIVL